jgi:integrase
MPEVHLTDIGVKALRAPERGQITYIDSTLPGFGVRVSQGGKKTFVLVHGRRRDRTTIGRYPILSLSQARNEAKRLLAERTLGNHRPASITFDEAFNLFLSTYCAQRNKASTTKDYERLLRTRFLPKFRGQPLEDITPHSIAAIVDKLLQTPSEANYAFAVARLFFKWAVKRHYLSHTPMEGMSLPSRIRARDRVLSEPELVSVWRAADETGYPFGTITKLLILTGQRRGEIAALRWDYIDQKQKTITLPALLTKNNRQHTFPYGDMTARIFENVPYQDGVLFPARGNPEQIFSGWSKCKAALDKKCVIAQWTLHDLRRTFATNLAALGTPVHVTEKLLNHSSGTFGGIVSVYQRHSYMDEMRAAVSAWDSRLTALLKFHQSST